MSKKYKINDVVFDTHLNKHIILDEKHQIFNSNTSWSDMTYYYNTLKFRNLNVSDKIEVYNTKPANKIKAEFLGFTKSLKYKVKLDNEKSQTFNFLF